MVLQAPGLSHIMRAHHNRLIILKTALSEEVGDTRINTGAMGDKGGHRVVKICREMCPERLVRNTAMDGLAIDDRKKPDNPSGGIICFAGGEFCRHETTFLDKRACSTVCHQDGATRPKPNIRVTRGNKEIREILPPGITVVFAVPRSLCEMSQG